MAVAFSPAWAPQLRSILRIVAGLMFMLHGTQKMLAFPDSSMPINPNRPTLMIAAGIIELVCGALIAVGLLTSIAAILASGQMAVAYFKVHAPNGFWPTMNQGELAALYCFVFLYLAFAGPGPWSLDALLFRRRT
ncbi:MAG TPA: DoxX family protein [Thermoanaerobaculia bacterium]|nr:DoxX family protein [Thermoanaerobaculia bacterium]